MSDDIGKKWEKKIAKIFGGKIQPGSGNKWFARLDITTGGFLISAKATTKDGIRVTKAMVNEVRRACLGPGGMGAATVPLIALDIDGYEMIVFSLDDFINLNVMVEELLQELASWQSECDSWQADYHFALDEMEELRRGNKS